MYKLKLLNVIKQALKLHMETNLGRKSNQPHAMSKKDNKPFVGEAKKEMKIWEKFSHGQ